MSSESLIMALAKVLIAAAWADGTLTHEEINSMKDLLWRVPQLTAQQWASLQIYIETPVDEAETARLVESLRSSIRSPEDRELALRTLDEMMGVDGRVTEEEERVAAEVRATIGSADMGLFTRMVKGMTSRRARAVSGAPNREDYLEDYIKNKVYYGVSRRVRLGEMEFDVGDDELRTLSLAGGMMAQIAGVNPEVTDAEVAAMVDALQTYWHLSPEQAAFVVEVAVSETASMMDPLRLAWQFADACGPEERAEFVNVLFAVAAADCEASSDEIEQIREFARTLKLTHREFIDAKLRIPRDQRQQ